MNLNAVLLFVAVLIVSLMTGSVQAAYVLNEKPSTVGVYLGVKAEATGKWRLEKIENRWWFITPEGNPFLMITVDGFNVWGVNTVEHPDKPELKKKFEWLPPKSVRGQMAVV